MRARTAWRSSSPTSHCRPSSHSCTPRAPPWLISPRGMPRWKMYSSRSPAGIWKRPSMGSSSALYQLVLSRLRLFLREPAAVFWVYGFPILMLISLGIAFREGPQVEINLDLIGSGDIATLEKKLSAAGGFKINSTAQDDWQK